MVDHGTRTSYRAAMVTFRTRILLAGARNTGIPVPPEVVEALGAGKRPKVHVTVSGYTYRSSVASMGGEFLIPLSAAHRSAAGVAAGDDVDVDLRLDTDERTVEVPADLAAALDAHPAARARFDALSVSNRSRHVLHVEGTKVAETRARRIEKTVATLVQEADAAT